MSPYPAHHPYPGYPPRRTCRAVARGVAAVAVLLLGAADALGTALLGIPPVAWTARRVGGAVRDAYRFGRYRFEEPSPITALDVVVIEGEIVDEEGNPL